MPDKTGKPMPTLSFEQGVVVGIIAMCEFRKAMDTGGGSFRPEAFMRGLVAKHGGKKAPGFPEGIPVETLMYTDTVVRSLTLANVI